jgi:hypothetical protein
MVQLKYFGDDRDYFKYDLITSIFEAKILNRYVFIPMLTDHRNDNEGNRKPIYNGDRSCKLYCFIMSCKDRSLNHWERWLTPCISSYHTIKPADNLFFRDISRAKYWEDFIPLIKTREALVFVDPDTGIETGKASYLKRMGPEKYILNGELRELFMQLDPESLLMIYQHLPNNEHIRIEAVQKKLKQVQSVCYGALTCAYREADLAFIFVTKSQEIFKQLGHLLNKYNKKSNHKYKTIVQIA